MQAKAIAIAAAIGIAALSWSSLPASAAECFRGTVTGPNGPGVMKGCMVRQHYVARAPRRTVTTTTRTLTRNYYITMSRPYTTTVTRDYYYSVPARDWDEEVYYGSSYPEPSRYYQPPRYYERMGY